MSRPALLQPRYVILRQPDPARFESTLKGLAYPSSKSALNMLTSQYAKFYPQMRINAVDPGYTATDFNGRRGTRPSRKAPRSSSGWRPSSPTARAAPSPT